MGVQLLLVLVVAAAAEKMCDDRLGCFFDEPPYSYTRQRWIPRTPSHPKDIDTKFLLFTREDPDRSQEISALNVSSVLETKFNPKKKSCFIIHGFLEWGNKMWLVDMCQTLLKVEDVNCFCVDWMHGALPWYTQAANNVRVVGAEVAYFIKYLKDRFSYPLSDVHLIGHSLGAHVAGEAGKRCREIARITGLDPAGPYFEDTPDEVRLDPSDAVLVDAIHTDGSSLISKFGLGGFGMKQLVGHLDFFPNGGEKMPGCSHSRIPLALILKIGNVDHIMDQIMTGILRAFAPIVSCNHLRSISYFKQTILHPNGFVGYPGPSYSDFQKGAGFPCFKGGCVKMGYYAKTRTRGSTGARFFLNTGDAENLLCWRYKVKVSITRRLSDKESFSVALCGSQMGCSRHHDMLSGSLRSETGTSYTSFIDVETEVYPVKKVVFVWHTSAWNFFKTTLGATSVTVQYGPNRETFHFCGSELTEERIHQTLRHCPS